MGIRDSWTTPKWLTDALGPFSLDPCSNPRSTVMAVKKLSLETGDDGLVHSWFGEDVFVNGPFSKLRPWAKKLVEAKSFVFLCNTDPSTEWWENVLVSGATYRLDFAKRIQFEPPPGVKKSTNSKPQSLLCDEAAFQRIGLAMDQYGVWWQMC